ncbi:MAG: hypothetical protein HZA08_02720 [Nitrospirae bacterium]|nr:hypothetical protein [Nitrospirota bacterium]
MKKVIHILIIVLTIISFGVAAHAATYTVTGTIKTPQLGLNATADNIPVKYIKVIVMDEDTLFDDTEGSGHTAADGTFSITFTDNVEAPDVYINVEYTGTAVDGHFIEVRTDHTDANPIKDENIEGIVHNDIAAGTLDLGVLRVVGYRANIISNVGDAVRFLKAQYPAWVMPEDLKAEGRTTNGASFVNGDGAFMSVAFEDYDHPGTGNAAFSDMHHETFHWVAYRAYGNRWPDFNCNVSPHGSDVESCEGFAMQEGSAQYFGSASAPPDNKTGAPSATDWRGEDGTGVYNSGEIVEGALERVWRLNNDIPGNLQVLLTDSPDSIKEFKDGYSSDKGSTSAAIRTFLDNCSANGIVYTRGKVDTFLPGDPPDAAPPAEGNFKIIDHIAFTRGKVKPTIVQLTAGELLLGPGSGIVDADKKDFAYKVAVAGVAEANTSGFNYVGFVGFTSDITWDTTTISDNDYDVLAQTRSTHEWWDDFNPDFTGDSNASTNSNEKWLKRLRTWYSQNPLLAGDDDRGKVIVDNTPPTVSNFKP